MLSDSFPEQANIADIDNVKCFSGILSDDFAFKVNDVKVEEGRGGQAQVDGGQRGQAPCGRPHRKLKLESTDVILYSSYAKKLASFLPEFRLWME